MIKLQNVNKAIKNKSILDSISLTFEEGKLYLVEGHNGCGKTMLLRLLCGLIKADSGTISFEKNYTFGAIIENPSFVESETVMENLLFLASIRKVISKEEIVKWLEILGLSEFKNKKVKTLSLGMKQRLALCQALMEDSDVILLDEPFNALDKDNLTKVIGLINELKNKNKIVVLAAHNISVKDSLNIDYFIEMENGHISNISS